MVLTSTLLALGLAGIPEAVAYLQSESARWKPENGCFSCHNNGDAARALALAGSPVDPATLAFLRDPAQWKNQNGKRMDPLAILQFALAAAAAKQPLDAALRDLASLQQPDGHWQMDAEASTGSPTTYGPVLGTALARSLLKDANPTAAAKAQAWLEKQNAQHPMDLAALVLALHRKDDIAKLIALQGKDGSWNGGEVFDTAIATIALQGTEAARRGRDWLLANQLQPGGWRGTTRPAGGQSYAQHMSTSAWALQALLATSKE